MTLKTKLAGVRAIRQFDNWIQIIVNRLMFPGTGCIVYRKGDVEMIVDHLGGDANGVRECLTSPMYRDLIEILVKRSAKKIRNVLDIGANGGGFALLNHLMGVPLKQLVCVEMNPRVFGRLSFNLYQNLRGVSLTLIQGAIAAKPGSVEVSLGRGSTGESLVSETSNPGKAEQIKLLSLDDIVTQSFANDAFIDLCKIDVEGAEYEVFLKAECKSACRIYYLIIEIHTVVDFSRDDLIARLNSLGFDDISPKPKSEEAVFLFQNRTLPGH